jgi:Na+/H+ antiporter NhaD/arsenite permease-like protein
MKARWYWTALGLLVVAPAHAAELPAVFGIPVDFILFALTLLGVALFHHHTLMVALTGLVVISLYKIGFTGFNEGAGMAGWLAHLQHEWVVLTNLLGLLLGFALLARHFEDSGVPHILPRFLPDDWKGAFVLLVMVFVLSSFLDNIAAALIGGTVAASVFQRRVHIGYLAAIVAASNAGGSGSVVGDTTTTMMWIEGVSPADVLHAYVAAAVALVVFGLFAARQQHAYQPIQKDASAGKHVDWTRLGIVAWILVAAIVTNIVINTQYPQVSDSFPFIGAAVWVAIVLAVPLRKPEWSLLPDATKGSIFLLSLVVCASMMPVEKLPPASWETAFGMGFVSAVFDNIPLTALALAQGGYDWGMLAYTVGFGGSMIWFGSSAGVALSNLFPEAKSVGAWLKGGWHVAVAYVIGFFFMLAVVGWHPHAPHKATPEMPVNVQPH